MMLLGATNFIHAQNYNKHTYWGSDVAGSEIEPAKIQVDKDGNVYAAAIFGGSEVDIIGEKTISNSSINKGDVVIVKMTPELEMVWKKTLVGMGTASIADMEMDQNGHLLITGEFSGTLQADETHSMSVKETIGYEMEAGYILRLSTDGNVVAMWQMPSESINVNDVTTDAENNVYVSGTFDSEMTFEEDNADAVVGDISNSGQMFVAKYTENGELLNLLMDDQANYSNLFIDVDRNANIYVGGTFMGSTTLAGTTLTTAENAGNMLIAKFNSAGESIWAKRIGGSFTDLAVGIQANDFGDVAICSNYLSEDITITGFGENEYFNNGFPNFEAEPEKRICYHIGIFTFTQESGDYRWWYTFGQGSTGVEGNCMAQYMHCTNEGVWYVGGRASSRYGDSSTINFGNAKSGIRLMDGTWVQHNTNGGADALYLVLNREGQLCSIGRPGSAQTEDLIDVALTPDKKGIYMFYCMQTRANQLIYTYVDNFWDSFTDMKNFGRTENYNKIRVFSSEKPSAENTYVEVVGFSSALVAKYDFPEINPDKLSIYTPGEAYSQTFSQNNPKGVNSKFYNMMLPEGMAFENNILSGTLSEDEVYYFGVTLTDSTALPGEITYYAQDPNHESIRGNSATVRYLKLATTEDEEPGSGVSTPIADGEAIFYPTLCHSELSIKTAESNYTVNIYNASGKAIGSFVNAQVIHVGNLPDGLYFVQLNAENGQRTFHGKFIKK